ncbi:MAG: outer rane efflux protein [Rhizobacter sp.]|nr:outer rane efflux protein [Rhizobacter sp.]
MRWAAVTLVLLLGGCAAYEARPLATHTDLARDALQLRVEAAAMPVPSLRSHTFDPRDGLDMTEVAMLAVANNPDLKALRAELGITRAQAFSAGLLPDPQLSLSRDSVLGAVSGATVALSAALTVDVTALLARSSSQAAANAETRKSDLNLLWQEWQTVARARLLFVKMDSLARSLALLREQRAFLAQRLDRARQAVELGLVTSDIATPQLTALQDVERQVNDLERQSNQARHDLNALLGVDPQVQLLLTGRPDVEAVDENRVKESLANAALQRPDLLALQAGYEAEDDRYRGALAAQFPAITLAPTRARDTSNVNTAGVSLGITLPIFNRNRGNIAIEQATREKLRGEYQQRLDTTRIDAHRLLAEQALLNRQKTDVGTSIDELAQAVQRARTAFTARQLDALTLTGAEASLMAKQLERIAIEQSLWEQAIGLHALIGDGLAAPKNTTHLPS